MKQSLCDVVVERLNNSNNIVFGTLITSVDCKFSIWHAEGFWNYRLSHPFMCYFNFTEKIRIYLALKKARERIMIYNIGGPEMFDKDKISKWP